MADRELTTYLNDHLAGSVTAIELIGHAEREHAGSELGAFLGTLKHEIEADRDSLKEIMASRGVGVDRKKVAAAWLTEKAARLKYRGGLGTLLELETLVLGITGKLVLWRALAEAWGSDERLDRLIARAQQQREEVERHRLGAGRRALTPGAA